MGVGDTWKIPKEEKRVYIREQGVTETKGIWGQKGKKRDMLSLLIWLWEQLRKEKPAAERRKKGVMTGRSCQFQKGMLPG